MRFSLALNPDFVSERLLYCSSKAISISFS
jgi:hypothetical protein